jgi:YaiO family outer membrane protein
VKRSFALVALAWLGRAFALEGEAGLSHETVTNNNADWNSVYLEAAHGFAPRQTLYGALREVERFDLRDSQIEAGYYHPLTGRLVGHVEGSASPDHHVLPKGSLFGEFALALDAGWVVAGGVRKSEYTATGTRVITASLERYFSRYRAFYTLANGKPEDAGSASSHRIGVDYYYAGERSRAGVSATWGREVENIVPAGIVTSDVRALNVYGRHWIAPQWAVTWELGTHEQGDFYRRTGGRLGLRRAF